MQNIVFLMLRRMRLPLIVLITTYAVSILGLVLIPGQDDQGNPWHMDFFHATYFVSFMGSTIGFGEIPYPFTDAQRMWTTFIIYATVVAWLYAIGSILSLIQDQGLRRALAFSAFARKVRRIQEPFHIVCGYGDAGALLVRELVGHGIHCVVVDASQERILDLEVEDLPDYVPALCGDATESDVLLAAGLEHPQCRSVLALSSDDHVNLTVAITSKLLAPGRIVTCRAENKDSAANMASFGTDYIIDPYEAFARRFGMMFHSPSMYLVWAWMTAVHNAPLPEFQKPPRGQWILCGYGRFGKAVQRQLAAEGIDTRIVEADIDKTGAPPGTIEGAGTEADTLLEAGVDAAAGIIAGTDNDTNNLSILMTARDLNPALFVVARQNRSGNGAIFEAARIDLVMHPGTIVAMRALSLILAPLLGDFLRLARDRDESWANVLVSRVVGVMDETAPEIWDIDIAPQQTPAVSACLAAGETVTLGDICTDPRDRDYRLPCVPLLLKRGSTQILLPEMDQRLQAGDRILFCGRADAFDHIHHLVHDQRALYYARTGIDRPTGAVWRWFAEHRAATSR